MRTILEKMDIIELKQGFYRFCEFGDSNLSDFQEMAVQGLLDAFASADEENFRAFAISQIEDDLTEDNFDIYFRE